MKKIVSVMLACSMVLSLAACGSSSQAAKSVAASQPASSAAVSSAAEANSSNGSIAVDKGLLDVTITLPKKMLDSFSTTAEEMQQAETDSRVKKTSVNEDGSLSITVSKSDHKEIMSEMKDAIDHSADNLKENFPSVQEIQSNSDCTQVDILVDRSAYENTLDSFAIISVEFQAMLYQAFNGTPDVAVTVNIVDQNSGEVLDSACTSDL